MSTDSLEDIFIPTYVINLKERTDRLQHIKQQFNGKEEFELHIQEACRHEIGAVGLWNSIVNIIKIAIENEDTVIIICEDDHIFTQYYDKIFFIKNILEAHEQSVDLLAGGIGGFNVAIPITQNRYWIDTFWCTQFIIIYRKFFKNILDVTFADTDTADGVLSKITCNKMVIYPFISIQKDFEYSDVTKNNNIKGNITEHFRNADAKLNIYKKVFDKYL